MCQTFSMIKCVSCKLIILDELITYKSIEGHHICIYCDEFYYVPFSQITKYQLDAFDMANKYLTHRYSVNFSHLENVIINKFANHEDKNKHILNIYNIDKRYTEIMIYARNKYYTSCIYDHMAAKYIYIPSYFAHKHIKFTNLIDKYMIANDKIITEYTHSLESNDDVKKKLDENYKSYCIIADKLKERAKYILDLLGDNRPITLKIYEFINDLDTSIITKNEIIKSGLIEESLNSY